MIFLEVWAHPFDFVSTTAIGALIYSSTYFCFVNSTDFCQRKTKNIKKENIFFFFFCQNWLSDQQAPSSMQTVFPDGAEPWDTNFMLILTLIPSCH